VIIDSDGSRRYGTMVGRGWESPRTRVRGATTSVSNYMQGELARSLRSRWIGAAKAWKRVSAVLAALIGATATIVVVWITQRMNRSADAVRFERERSLRHDEWQRGRRADTYEKLATFLIGERGRVDLPSSADSEAMTDDDWRSMHGQIDVFASRMIRGIVDSILTERVKFGTALWQLRELQLPPDVDVPPETVAERRAAREDLRAAQRGLRELIDAATDAMRAEMGSNDS
jgi:hypothetical protein